LHFILSGSLQLLIQEQTDRLASRWRTGQQQQGDLPVIKLQAIALLSVDGALQAAGTVAQVSRVAFVAVQNHYAQAVKIG
jgi:hypothetical protein